MKCNTCGCDIDDKMLDKLKKYSVPFVCDDCGMLTFPYRALNGIVMVWPNPVPEKRGAIYIPERVRSAFRTNFGMVMSAGKGCIEKRTGKFVSAEVIPGDILSYDSGVPWHIDIADSTGKKYTLDMINVLDVQATVEEEE